MSIEGLEKKVAYGSVALLAALVIGYAGWATNFLVGLDRGKLDKAEIHNLPYPYLEEKANVNAKLDEHEKKLAYFQDKVDNSLETLVQNNIVAITELKVQMKNSQEQEHRLERAIDRLTGELKTTGHGK